MLAELNVVEGAYFRDVLEQPAAMRRFIAWTEAGSPSIEGIACALRQGRYKRVVLTGMGSSHHALYGLHLQLIQTGCASVLVETAELIHYFGNPLDESTLLIVVSQSGRSAEVVRLLARVQGRADLIAVTNGETSALGTASPAAILLKAGPEATVSCKTYVCTLLALEWLGEVLTGGSAGSPRPAMERAADAVDEYLGRWRTHVGSLMPLLSGVRQLFLTGRGASISTALTGGLILKESARFPSEGMSCAAFRHGPLEMVSPAVLVMVMEGDSTGASLNRRLVADVESARGRAALISPDAEPGPWRLPYVDDRLRTTLEILPVQMVSLALAALADREAGRFELASKVTAVE